MLPRLSAARDFDARPAPAPGSGASDRRGQEGFAVARLLPRRSRSGRPGPTYAAHGRRRDLGAHRRAYFHGSLDDLRPRPRRRRRPAAAQGLHRRRVPALGVARGGRRRGAADRGSSSRPRRCASCSPRPRASGSPRWSRCTPRASWIARCALGAPVIGINNRDCRPSRRLETTLALLPADPAGPDRGERERVLHRRRRRAGGGRRRPRVLVGEALVCGRTTWPRRCAS